MKRSRIYFGCIYLLILISQFQPISAWSNVGEENRSYGTHAWIADHAFTSVLLAENISPENSRYSWLKTYRQAFLRGTLAPDRPFVIVSGADPFDYFDQLNHHNYYDAEGNLIEDYASERAQQEYEKALTALDNGEMELAAFYTGTMCHYLGDLSNFMHVMGSDSALGKEPDGYHDDYEKNIREQTDNISDSYFNITYTLPQKLTIQNAAYEAGRWMGWNAHQNATWMVANFQSTFKGGRASSEFELRTGALLNDVINLLANLIFTLGYYTEITNHGTGAAFIYRSVVFLAIAGFMGIMTVLILLLKRKQKRKNQ